MGDREERLVRKWDRKGEIKITQHTVYSTAAADVAASKLSYWSKEQSSTFREFCALEFMFDTYTEKLNNSSVLLQAANKGLYCVLKKGFFFCTCYTCRGG